MDINRSSESPPSWTRPSTQRYQEYIGTSSHHFILLLLLFLLFLLHLLCLLLLSLPLPLPLPAYSAVLCSAGGSHPARSLPKHSTQRPQDTEHHAQPQEDGAQNGRLWNLQSPLLQNHLCTNSMETLISVTSFPGHMPGVWD